MSFEVKEQQLLLDRWNRYQETGESIPNETVVKWPKTWGSNKEKQCPISQN